MNRSNVDVSLRALAAEPTNETSDPWPEIRHKLQARQSGTRRAGVTRKMLTGVAAALVVGVAAGAALFANQASTASADEVLQQVAMESVAIRVAGPGTCGSGAATAQTGGVVAYASGVGADTSGPVSAADANQLSDKLAQALGVSGDQLRQAMRQAMGPNLPSTKPADPIASIARQLGVSTQQVCAAFANQNPQAPKVLVSGSAPADQQRAVGHVERSAVISINGTMIDLETNNADQLSGPAQKLGVSPDKLLAAVKAAVPAPPALPAGPPNEDELINRLAQNLGMSSDKVRAAIIQVEGPNRFYFVVPLPGLGHSS